jgi:hypothetical protein
MRVHPSIMGGVGDRMLVLLRHGRVDFFLAVRNRRRSPHGHGRERTTWRIRLLSLVYLWIVFLWRTSFAGCLVFSANDDYSWADHGPSARCWW